MKASSGRYPWNFEPKIRMGNTRDPKAGGKSMLLIPPGICLEPGPPPAAAAILQRSALDRQEIPSVPEQNIPGSRRSQALEGLLFPWISTVGCDRNSSSGAPGQCHSQFPTPITASWKNLFLDLFLHLHHPPELPDIPYKAIPRKAQPAKARSPEIPRRSSPGNLGSHLPEHSGVPWDCVAALGMAQAGSKSSCWGHRSLCEAGMTKLPGKVQNGGRKWG